MDFNLETLLDDLGFAGEERATATALLTPRVNKVKSRFMAQADYSRGKDELTRLQAKITKDEETLRAEYETVATWERNIGTALGVQDVNQVAPRLNAMLAELKTAKDNAAALQAELTKHATDYGFTPTLPSGAPANPNGNRNGNGNGNGNPSIDTSKFLTRDSMQSELQAFPYLAAELQDLNVEHQRLFGVPLPNSTAIVKAALESAKEAEKYRDPSRLKKIQQVWEETHNVSAKRAEIAKTAEDTRVETRVQEELTKRASQQGSSPIPNAGIPGSPILAHQFKPAAPDGKVVPVGAGADRRGVESALKNFGSYYGGQSQ